MYSPARCLGWIQTIFQTLRRFLSSRHFQRNGEMAVARKRAVAVIGGGLAGLACALAAARAGAEVDLFEARPVLDGLPAHVDVVPSMMRDLAQLGVGDACVRAGFAYRRTSAIGQHGLPLYTL